MLKIFENFEWVFSRITDKQQRWNMSRLVGIVLLFLLLGFNEQSYVQGILSLNISCDSTLPLLPGLSWLTYGLINLAGSPCVFSEPFSLSNGTIITMSTAGATMIFQNTTSITCSGTFTIQSSTPWAVRKIFVIMAATMLLTENFFCCGYRVLRLRQLVHFYLRMAPLLVQQVLH